MTISQTMQKHYYINIRLLEHLPYLCPQKMDDSRVTLRLYDGEVTPKKDQGKDGQTTLIKQQI